MRGLSTQPSYPVTGMPELWAEVKLLLPTVMRHSSRGLFPCPTVAKVWEQESFIRRMRLSLSGIPPFWR